MWVLRNRQVVGKLDSCWDADHPGLWPACPVEKPTELQKESHCTGCISKKNDYTRLLLGFFSPQNNYNIGGLWGKDPSLSPFWGEVFWFCFVFVLFILFCFIFLHGVAYESHHAPRESQVPKWGACLTSVGVDLNPRHDDNPNKLELILAWASRHCGAGLATHLGMSFVLCEPPGSWSEI